MLYNKIQVLCSYILCLVCCLVYPTCLGYVAFLIRFNRIAQNIQSAQIESSELNTINALHEICTSCHNTCNTSEKILIIIISYLLLHLSFLFLNRTL